MNCVSYYNTSNYIRRIYSKRNRHQLKVRNQSGLKRKSSLIKVSQMESQAGIERHPERHPERQPYVYGWREIRIEKKREREPNV